MNLDDAVSFISDSAAKSADAFDVIAGHSRSEGVSVFKGKVQNTEISESVGVGIRVFKNSHPGYAYTERFTEDALSQTVRDALSHCVFTKDIPIELPRPQELRKFAPHYSAEIEKLGLPEMTAMCLDIEKATFAASPEVENVPYLGADKSEGRVIVANGNGLRYESHFNSASAGVGAVALRDGIRKLGVCDRSGRDWNAFDAKKIADTAVSRARELLSPSKIESGKIPVVFSNRVSGSIVSMYSSAFFAEQVQKGQSRLQGLLGKSIATRGFSLVNDPFREDLPGASAFDGEGVPTERVSLVKDGILQSYLYNLETAAREGRKSNGSASRNYSGKVSTGFSNLVVLPGERTTEELLKLFPRCLYVVNLEGNSGCSAISGELNIGAQGIWYENGTPVHAAEGVTLSANFFDLLKLVAAVGSEYNDSYSSIKVPAFAVAEIAVSN